MLRRVLQRITQFVENLKMAEPAALLGNRVSSRPDNENGLSHAEKRLHDKTEEDAAEAKKAKFVPAPPMQGRIDRKRKVALLLAYCGEGYFGIQRNPGVLTIEEEVIKALRAADLIPQEHADVAQKMSFQRAARTDKGVSAVGQVLSLKMLINGNVVEEINKHLPEKIRVLGYRRGTKGFNSKNHCTGRTYLYMTPTYAFAPFDMIITEDYRTNDKILKQVREILPLFKGTHNFHNFTSGVKPTESQANRYIVNFECGEPFVQEGIEFVLFKVHGQSFMIHQIRKMVGITVAIVRGFCDQEIISKAWQPEKIDIPKAPGTGLLLDQVFYEGYNKKFGKDGMHEAIVWDEFQEQMEQFKKNYIFSYIVNAEKKNKVMMNWLTKLHSHKFDVREEGDRDGYYLFRKLDKLNQTKEAASSEESKTVLDGQVPVALDTSDARSDSESPDDEAVGKEELEPVRVSNAGVK